MLMMFVAVQDQIDVPVDEPFEYAARIGQVGERENFLFRRLRLQPRDRQRVMMHQEYDERERRFRIVAFLLQPSDEIDILPTDKALREGSRVLARINLGHPEFPSIGEGGANFRDERFVDLSLVQVVVVVAERRKDARKHAISHPMPIMVAGTHEYVRGVIRIRSAESMAQIQ